MPLQTGFFPIFIPLLLCTRSNKKLHFHLLKLTHAENKLTRDNFITKSFSDLCNTKGNFHSSGLLHIEKIDKNTLCRFGAQVYFVILVIGRNSRTKLCSKHEIELTNIRPVACTTNRTFNLLFVDQFF